VIGLVALLVALLIWPLGAGAAEILQVRDADLLQLGDQNRSYTVQLACIAVSPEHENEAIAWLRQAAPRYTKVNLRPMGQNQGVLLAMVTPLATATDLGSGLVAAGLAELQTGALDPCP
jgi:endonuclease YncB( thermonuclease family)